MEKPGKQGQVLFLGADEIPVIEELHDPVDDPGSGGEIGLDYEERSFRLENPYELLFDVQDLLIGEVMQYGTYDDDIETAGIDPR